ncbi:MAG: hypothetical protein EOP83_11480 [Verrucomicrobiaceae bacterium]|nr:MAG: hypothetical protein EOP83_11480 [Verrucomicrobiaceae bacterium]
MTDRNADMRHILAQVRTLTGGTVVEASAPQQKWWLNVNTGETVVVKRAHGDMTQENPGRFGITQRMIDRIKTEHPDLNPQEGHELSWWELVRYEAQKNGWVRIGSEQEFQSVARPYVYAASVRHAQKAITWMMRKGIIVDVCEVEINNPEEPVEGYGEFIELPDEAALKRFLRTGR